MAIDRNVLHLKIASLIALRGKCLRARVGSVITQNNRIIATGYNGAPMGAPDCVNTCNVENPCSRAIHAEANAIAFAAKEGIKLEGSKLHCTHAPCLKCAELIIQAGIKEVVYMNPYRTDDGIHLLTKHNVIVTGIPAIVVEEETLRSINN